MQEPYAETCPSPVPTGSDVLPVANVPARPVVPTEILVRRFDELTDSQLADWSRFQQADPALESPYFRPEFTRIVASAQDDVEVALLRADGRSVGFFPFERRGRSVADRAASASPRHAPPGRRSRRGTMPEIAPRNCRRVVRGPPAPPMSIVRLEARAPVMS